MRNVHHALIAAAAVIAGSGAYILNAGITRHAHATGIVCWKDASGKTIGCGDHVPPEYKDNGAEEINKQGRVVREIQPVSDTVAQEKAAADKAAKAAAEAQAQKDQQRKDKALLNAFTTVCEIDDKYKRDSQLIQAGTDTLNTNLQNNQERQTQVRDRIAAAPNDGPAQQELERLTAEQDSLHSQIAQKQQQLTDLTKDYQTTRQRFVELRGDATDGGCAAKP